MLNSIRTAWAWRGIVPTAIVDENAFGNVIILDDLGRFWRICPEELRCDLVAENREQYQDLRGNSEFERDWQMSPLVQMARGALGEPGPERCFCLKIPGVLGGRYEVSNFGTISREELLRFSGDVAEQIRNLPDGSQVKIQSVD